MENRGLIHLYYGDGAGKTTAAFGLALRALGHAKRVAVVQFLKARPSGEALALGQNPGALVLWGQAGDAFFAGMSEAERAATKQVHDENLKRAMGRGAAVDLLVLDEALDACQLGLLDEALFRAAVLEKPPSQEVVVTGHRPEAWLAARADYVTEMRKEKHPYDGGVAARAGVEY